MPTAKKMASEERALARWLWARTLLRETDTSGGRPSLTEGTLETQLEGRGKTPGVTVKPHRQAGDPHKDLQPTGRHKSSLSQEGKAEKRGPDLYFKDSVAASWQTEHLRRWRGSCH